MSTLHRSDINSTDVTVLARFSRALNVLESDFGPLPWPMGEQLVLLPVWRTDGSEWYFAEYKHYNVDVIGIETKDFRRISRYLQTHENVLLDTLFRLSMLAVAPIARADGKPFFRQEFTRCYQDRDDNLISEPVSGFIIERRRAVGGFK